MNPILENTLEYTHIQYYMVSHFLTFGYAAMACGLVYFAFTAFLLPPEKRMGSILSIVVMISAVLILQVQAENWLTSFRLNQEGMWIPSMKSSFSNAYRYLNWLIDVPVLLTILLLSLGVEKGPDFVKRWSVFTVSGALMIVTGYIGQFYQLSNITNWWIWFFISCAFYLVILYMAIKTISTEIPRLPDNVKSLAKSLPWFFLVFWNIYVIAYLIPYIAPNAWGVVWKQGLYTLADVGSKVIFGIVVTHIALRNNTISPHNKSADKANMV